jgi:hypothetical protein
MRSETVANRARLRRTHPLPQVVLTVSKQDHGLLDRTGANDAGF